MLLPLFENDFVLAKVLPVGTVNNTITMVAIAKANTLWSFAMLMYCFRSPYVSSTSSISELVYKFC